MPKITEGKIIGDIKKTIGKYNTEVLQQYRCAQKAGDKCKVKSMLLILEKLRTLKLFFTDFNYRFFNCDVLNNYLFNYLSHSHYTCLGNCIQKEIKNEIIRVNEEIAICLNPSEEEEN